MASLSVTIELGVGAKEAVKELTSALEKLCEAANVKESKKAKAAPSEEAEEKSHISIEEIKSKRGRKPKADKKAIEEAEDIEDLSEEDMPEGEDFDADDENEEPEELEEAEPLTEEQLAKLKAALKAYSAKHGKAKAIKVLNQFGERSDLVKPSDLPKLIKLLKV